jgi:hypothetical protein
MHEHFSVPVIVQTGSLHQDCLCYVSASLFYISVIFTSTILHGPGKNGAHQLFSGPSKASFSFTSLQKPDKLSTLKITSS